MKKIIIPALIAILSLISLAVYATIKEYNSPYVEQCPTCKRYYLYPPEWVASNTWRYTCAYCGCSHNIQIEEPLDTTASFVTNYQQPSIISAR